MNRPAITALITIQTELNSYPSDLHFQDFGGKPLYNLMIEKLLEVETIERIVITTDSDLVRNKYNGNGKVSFIEFEDPETFSDNNQIRILEEMPTSDRQTKNALDKISGEHFLQTQCTNPILRVETIREVIERYYTYVLNDEYQQFDSVMSLQRIEKRLYDMNDYPKITLRDNPHFVIFEDTVFNVFNRTSFNRNQNKKFGTNPMFFEVPEIENITVETAQGYRLAKLVYDNRKLFF